MGPLVRNGSSNLQKLGIAILLGTMRSKNIFEVCFCISNVLMQYKEFCELLQTTIIAPIYDTGFNKIFLKLAFIIWDIFVIIRIAFSF